VNLLTHCPLCGWPYSRAYPDAHPATNAAHELMPCPCEAEHSKLNRRARETTRPYECSRANPCGNCAVCWD
jgi:hypothetical protein